MIYVVATCALGMTTQAQQTVPRTDVIGAPIFLFQLFRPGIWWTGFGRLQSGSDVQILQMCAKLVVVIIVISFNGRVLDGAVHVSTPAAPRENSPRDCFLILRTPRMVWLAQPMLDAVGLADHVETHGPEIDCVAIGLFLQLRNGKRSYDLRPTKAFVETLSNQTHSEFIACRTSRCSNADYPRSQLVMTDFFAVLTIAVTWTIAYHIR
ncbi:hypothetical protein TRL7639_00462 [Falsiruegeria litorea R37]|uniref:Uncharacterized protein n=1 Tax=Falsiruegeria litorea R37 TaxID=1200284 RepID=A0A1Y5RMB4_9RHOB|nr:hypothetical protein TRL7639_00462 [Falsiruegeria litorea R37]